LRRPATTFKIEDFPDPVGPTTETNCPRGISKETSSRAGCPEYVTVIEESEISGTD
jgi:hypothetical protein